MIVAIDGPSGAGKSSAAAALARKTGFYHLDTGRLYRAVAWVASRKGIDPGSPDLESAVERLCRGIKLELRPSPVAPEIEVWLDGEPVGRRLRAAEVGALASALSVLKPVREFLLPIQREARRLGSLVVEGRDIGTVIFPDAEVKFFLDARPEARARRRWEEGRGTAAQAGSGAKRTPSLADVEREIAERDARDRRRPISPLRPGRGAIVIDSSDLTLEEVVARMMAAVRERGSAV